jgi:hypothetical protein
MLSASVSVNTRTIPRRNGHALGERVLPGAASCLILEYFGMGRVNDTVSNVNATLRNLLLAALVGVAGVGGYTAYNLYNEPKQQLADTQAELEKSLEGLRKANSDLAARQREIADLNKTVAEKTAQVDRLEVRLKLLSVRHRLARLKVLDQREVAALNPVPPAQGDESPASRPNLVTKIEFSEVNEQGEPIGQPKQFDIVGDMVYVDFLRVTFEDKFVEQSDIDRSTALALFQRIFGEHQEPVEGFQLDTVGTRPTAYGRGTEMSEFEKRIWDDFWLIANDPKRAAEMGIRAAHGDAVSIRVRPGKTYEIDLRSTGEISARVVEPPAPPAIAPGAGN